MFMKFKLDVNFISQSQKQRDLTTREQMESEIIRKICVAFYCLCAQENCRCSQVISTAADF